MPRLRCVEAIVVECLVGQCLGVVSPGLIFDELEGCCCGKECLTDSVPHGHAIGGCPGPSSYKNDAGKPRSQSVCEIDDAVESTTSK